MERAEINGCFEVGNQILNTMALGNPDRDRHCSYLTDTGSLGPKIIAAAYFIVLAR